MSPEISLSPEQFAHLIGRLEARFHLKLDPPQFPQHFSLIELSEAVHAAFPENDTAHDRHALVWIELEKGLALALGRDVQALAPSTPMRALFPAAQRKADWASLAEVAELRLPKLGTPPWMQHLLGALLLAGFILPFYRLWLGLAVFWGTLLLSWPLEKQWAGFRYPTFGQTVARTVQLNPQLEFDSYNSPAGILPLVAEILAGIPGWTHGIPTAQTKFSRSK